MSQVQQPEGVPGVVLLLGMTVAKEQELVSSIDIQTSIRDEGMRK